MFVMFQIIHDCRLLSDLLYHQYQAKLVNVFDTQVGVFTMSDMIPLMEH